MAYSNFTLTEVQETFQLEKVLSTGLFSEIKPVEPSAYLSTVLGKKAALATAIGTEKARSELIVADILFELREHLEERISLFSGIEFNVDAKNGLVGVCDFLVSLSPDQLELQAPIIILVEAKNLDLKQGLGQCVAEMLAAQRFNAEKGNNIRAVYGATTTGIDWQFLKLEEKHLHLDMATYTLERCDRLLGILVSMVEQKA